jgi:tRNA(Ile)-lysidine synthase
MDLLARVRLTIREHALVPRGGRIAVALSGGADSGALVHILRELEAAAELTVAGLAHFNHQLRGRESDEDESFCRALAASLGLPIDVGTADVRELARTAQRSVEDAGRAARYAFLEAAANRLGADVVAVAHSQDDQAETFLLRLMRGAGPRGLAGILPRAGRVVRPLLDVTRRELRHYAADRSLRFRDDSSNADLTIPRNRIRHELIPYLERELAPGVSRVLAREAEIARQDEDHLSRKAIDLAASIVLTDGTSIDAARLTTLHPALASRVVRHALSRLAAGRFVGFDHLERFLDFARHGRPGSMLSLPGQRAVHRGPIVELEPNPGRTRPGGTNSFHVPLSIPGEAAGDGWAVSAEPLEAAAWAETYKRARGQVVVIARRPSSLPLAVRSRRPGDRFSPLGMGGRHTKLQDFLVNRRVPRAIRDGLPLVVDRDDRIVWVVGESVSEDFRVTDPSQGVILLKARRLGGPG